MSKRVYNFSAGPSALPLDVLKEVGSEITNYKNSGMSVMELSHRSKEYDEIHNNAVSYLKKLMNVPDNYSILFMQGGATLQFSAVPLNLKKIGKADYLVTGAWAKKAHKEANKFLDAKIVFSSEDKNYSYLNEIGENDIRKDIDYFHITGNNTIYGTRIDKDFKTNAPIVNDMSSYILSEEIDVNKYGLIYAGAQKNIGPAGLSVVIVRDDLISKNDEIPTYLSYEIHKENNSLYNTPPTFAIYFASLVFKGLLDKGGIKEIEKENIKKAELLYDFIDNSTLYQNNISKDLRSRMNVIFVTGNEELDKKFILEAKGEGLVNLAGHRSIGGMRASIYNALDIESVKALINFMEKFEKVNS